jgi:hypothetical protein
MICPVCQLELGAERQAGEVVLTYSLNDWVQRCRYQRGDPALCSNLMPTILELLTQSNSARSEARKPPK